MSSTYGIICPHCDKSQDDVITRLNGLVIEALIKCQHCEGNFKVTIMHDELTIEGI